MEKTPKTSSPSAATPVSKKLIAVLRANEERILTNWEAAVRREVEPAHDRDQIALRNSLPVFLGEIYSHLEQNFLVLVEGGGAALSHAAQRAALQPEYQLAQILDEYDILACALWDVLDEAGITPTPYERNILARFFQSGKKAAAVRFAELARRDSDLLEALFEATPIGTALLDRDFRYLRINEALARVNGHAVKEHIGRSVSEIVPDVAAVVMSNLERVRDSGRAMLNLEVEAQIPTDRKTHQFLINYYPLKSEKEVWGIGAQVIEITERKRIEKEREVAVRDIEILQEVTEAALSVITDLDELLQVSLEKIRAAFSSDNETVLLRRESVPGGECLEVRALLGFQEKISPKFHVSVDETFAGSVLRAGTPIKVDNLNSSDPRSPVLHEVGVRCLIDVPLRTSERILGVLHVSRNRPAPFKDEDVKLLQLIADRMTVAIVNAELYGDLRKSLCELETERALRERFVSGLTHDLRNPLAAAKAGAELIRRFPEPAERVALLGDKILTSIARAEGMIQDMLDVGRIRAGKKLMLNPAPGELVRLINSVREEMSAVYGNRLKVSAPNGKIEGVWDHRELRRAIENLVNNAFKYGYDTTPVTIEAVLDGDRAEISVHNLGEPIAAELQAKLFQSYQRGGSVGIQGKKGWGIGLMLVRGVAEAHGGSVRVESSREAGTRFILSLPIVTRSSSSDDPP